MKPTRTWVVVADGARARMLLHEKPGGGLQQVPGCDFRAPHPQDIDIVADRPGRTFDSGGPGRHAMEARTSPHRHNKAEFARWLAEFLDLKHGEGEFDRLVIAAAPATLGDLRPLLSKAITNCVAGELSKDLTNLPNEEIAQHVESFLAV